MIIPTVFALALCTVSGVAALPPPAPPAPHSRESRASDFFEARVRPVLVEHCITCHGPERQKGGLRLDAGDRLRKGGNSGPVVVPGDPDHSTLIRAVRQDGEIKMPPKGKLPPQAVEDLAAWVNSGAPWPGEGGGATVAATANASPSAKTHWAFQPVQEPSLPDVANTAWPTSPVDYFILARLDSHGMAPAPPADRRTLLRRVTFDLLGLPPTAEEIAAFEADPAANAYEKVVDRLLASPHYGERWGRFWLDVARYADSKGYLFEEERRYPYAYTYRDYVIRALNEDLPYDQFILQQLAADQLPSDVGPGPLAGMGFLTVGGRFMNNQHDIIDDRIDVVSRGLLGLTVTCARCHDHKYDPIPTRDYYSLYGVFANSEEPTELPLLKTPEPTPAYLAFEKELGARRQKLNEFLAAEHAALAKGARTRVGDHLLAAQRQRGDTGPPPSARGLNLVMVQRWGTFLESTRQEHHPIFAPWHAFAALPAEEFGAKASALAVQIATNRDPAKPVHPLVAWAFAGKAPVSLDEVAQRYNQLFATVDQLWHEVERQAAEDSQAAEGLSDSSQEELRQILYGPEAPPQVPLEEMESYIPGDGPARKKLEELRRALQQFEIDSPVAPPRAMVLRDAPALSEPHVFLRGNPDKVGEAVPRQFLQVIAGEKRQPFQQGSGRLELAEAILRADNPLTARVIVNRVWLHHFGAGLVRTPSDFGLRSEPPSHPELLDYLAGRFMEEGWSLKKLHRLLCLSSVYTQSTADHPAFRQADPENRLLWRMNRRRLDFEALRDSVLAVAGALDRTMGGRPVPVATPPGSNRRTVYGFIDRQNLPGLLRTFDFPSPETTSPQRFETTVPLQALFLMNSPFLLEQARRLAARPEVRAEAQAGPRIQALYRLAYGRAADPEEVGLALRLVQGADVSATGGQPPAGLTAWERLAQVLLLANEFAFFD